MQKVSKHNELHDAKCKVKSCWTKKKCKSKMQMGWKKFMKSNLTKLDFTIYPTEKVCFNSYEIV